MNQPHPDDDRLIAYALGDLESGERVPVEAHLAGCDACAAQVELLARGLEVERAPRRGAAPLHLLVALLGRQMAARRRRAAWRLLGPLPAAAALGGLLFAGGYSQGRHAVARNPAARSEARRTLERGAPLPALPPLPVETATASAGDPDYFAFTLGSWPRAAGDSTTNGDSL